MTLELRYDHWFEYMCACGVDGEVDNCRCDCGADWVFDYIVDLGLIWIVCSSFTCQDMVVGSSWAASLSRKAVIIFRNAEISESFPPNIWN